MKVILIKTDHTVQEVETEGNLKSLQSLVGGMIECLGMTGEVHAYIDEEGKCKGKEPNVIATMLCRKLAIGLMPGDIIVGDMILLGTLNKKGEADGEEHSFPDKIAQNHIFSEVFAQGRPI